MEEIKEQKEGEITKKDLNRINFKFELATIILKRMGYNNFIKKIIELPQDKIGILNSIKYDECLFLIYSSKTFKKIKQFEFHFNDVVKMEDNSLVLSNEYNIYYYELKDNEYKLIQTIQCYENEKDEYYSHPFRYERDPNTSILSIHALKNGNLIVKSIKQMKLYKKDNGKFLYSKTVNFEYYISTIFEIKPNIIVLFLQERLGSGCVVTGFNYFMSLYDIKNDKKNIIGQRTDYLIDDYYNTKPFLKIDNN